MWCVCLTYGVSVSYLVCVCLTYGMSVLYVVCVFSIWYECVICGECF